MWSIRTQAHRSIIGSFETILWPSPTGNMLLRNARASPLGACARCAQSKAMQSPFGRECQTPRHNSHGAVSLKFTTSLRACLRGLQDREARFSLFFSSRTTTLASAASWHKRVVGVIGNGLGPLRCSSASLSVTMPTANGRSDCNDCKRMHTRTPSVIQPLKGMSDSSRSSSPGHCSQHCLAPQSCR